MIQGIVVPRMDPRVSFDLFDWAGVRQTISASIDTAFYGSLALPLALITHLALPTAGEGDIQPADGSTIPQAYYEAQIEWDGVTRIIRVVELGNEPLIGVHLLWNRRLIIDMVNGGRVSIESLSEISP